MEININILTKSPVHVHITWQLVLGWLTIFSTAVPGILPILPESVTTTLPWLKPVLLITTVIIGAILRSPTTPPAATLARKSVDVNGPVGMSDVEETQ